MCLCAAMHAFRHCPVKTHTKTGTHREQSQVQALARKKGVYDGPASFVIKARINTCLQTYYSYFSHCGVDELPPPCVESGGGSRRLARRFGVAAATRKPAVLASMGTQSSVLDTTGPCEQCALTTQSVCMYPELPSSARIGHQRPALTHRHNRRRHTDTMARSPGCEAIYALIG